MKKPVPGMLLSKLTSRLKGGHQMLKARNFLFVLISAGLLVGCQTTPDTLSSKYKADDVDFMTLVKNVKSDRLGDDYIRAGLELLDKQDYIHATKAFNKALKFDPTDANLHFLNALTYHLRAMAGDSSQLDMAKVGYGLALQYDASNYWAAYQLGQISYDEQRYRDAQDAFAYSLLYAPENPDLLRALATASYNAQDLETALSAIYKASELRPDDEGIIYDSALINAAAGRMPMAEADLVSYTQTAGAANPFREKLLTNRLGDWRRFHKENKFLKKVQSTSDIFGSKATSEGLKPSASSSSSSKKGKDRSTRMALVDVVIIRSEERLTTNKGVNLLSGLSATLGGTLTFNKVDAHHGDVVSSVTNNLTWAPTLTFASSAYSLNIFNDNNDRNEVLARPTLVALDGKKSEFFSGAVWHVELTGSAGSEGAVQDIPVGIKLDVTPVFLSDDKVELNVTAARAFVENRSSTANFNNFAQTTKTLLTANVAMKFGETLILSGLSEKESETVRDGVPLLQDVPVVQYLFSNETTLDFTKSVLILLTPRQPRFSHEDGTVKVDPANPPDAMANQENLKELKKMSGFRPASTVDSVLWHLRNGKYFKEFRSGDVRMEKWDYPSRLNRMIVRTIEFLYY
jgi:Flp pilus assembly protein TadD